MENKEEKNNEINLNNSSKDKITTNRRLNKKNIIKAIVVILGVITLIGMTGSFFGSSKTEEKPQETTEFEEKDVGTLENQSYNNSRINEAIEENINRTDEIKEEPYYAQEAVEPDPYAEYLKEQELEKLKRYYDARKAPFNESSKKVNLMSSGDYGRNDSGINLVNPNQSAYSSDSDYMNYITAGIGGGGSSDPNMQKEKKAWLKNAAINSFVLQKPLIPSITKYEVKAGTYVPITLIPSINSDIVGSFTAIVREDIYDTNTGTERLIPMGSKIFGQFNSEVSWGQTRLQAVFNRLTLPNGKSINLGSMGAADLEGQTGLTGKVNTHIGKVIGSVVMAGVVGSTEALLTDNGDSKKDKNAALNGGGEAAADKGLDIVDKFTSKVLNVQPTITIKAGTRATLVVGEDIILEKYDKEIKYLNN